MSLILNLREGGMFVEFLFKKRNELGACMSEEIFQSV